MATKIKIFISLLLLISVSMTAYYKFKSENLRSAYTGEIEKSMSLLSPLFNKIENGAGPESRGKGEAFENIIGNNNAIAFIASVDMSGGIGAVAKNNREIGSASVFDAIIKDLRAGEFEAASHKPVLKSYAGADGSRKDLFIAGTSAGKGKTIVAFIFKPDRKTVIRMVLEIVLIIIFCVIIVVFIFMYLTKKGIIQDNREIKETTIILASSAKKYENREIPGNEADTDNSPEETAPPIPIDESELARVFSPDEREASRGAALKNIGKTDINSEALNSRIFELFKKIHKDFAPESISLYIKKTKESMNKTYELKGKAFLRIDSAVIDKIDMRDLHYLKKSGAHISHNGTLIRIPLIHDDSLTGLVEIKLTGGAEEIDLALVQNELKDTAREIKEYLVINNVITDSSTGFYSTAYFNMKLSEEIYKNGKTGSGFTLLLIDIFNNIGITDEQKKTVLKIIHPGIRDLAGETCDIFLLNDFIASIISDSSGIDAGNTGESFIKNLSRYRIKLDEDEIFTLKPSIALVHTSECDNPKNILEKGIGILS